MIGVTLFENHTQVTKRCSDTQNVNSFREYGYPEAPYGPSGNSMDQEVRILDLIQHRHFTGGGIEAREATSSLAPALGLQALGSGGQ